MLICRTPDLPGRCRCRPGRRVARRTARAASGTNLKQRAAAGPALPGLSLSPSAAGPPTSGQARSRFIARRPRARESLNSKNGRKLPVGQRTARWTCPPSPAAERAAPAFSSLSLSFLFFFSLLLFLFFSFLFLFFSFLFIFFSFLPHWGSMK